MQSFFPLLTEDLFLKENWIKIQRAAFQPGTRRASLQIGWKHTKSRCGDSFHQHAGRVGPGFCNCGSAGGRLYFRYAGTAFLSRKSETYQNCLPLTALRSDSGGDHVFVLRRQSSVLGTEWVIARVDITVKERDSQMMYVDGALTYSDQVVIGLK